MVKTRRKGDYGSEELPIGVRMEIQAALFWDAITAFILIGFFLAFFLFITVIVIKGETETIHDMIELKSVMIFIELLLKYGGPLLLDFVAIYALIKYTRTSICFGQGRFTYRLAKVTKKKEIKRDEGANSYFVTCADEEFGGPEHLGISLREFKKTEIGGYVYVIYMDESCKISPNRIVHHAKDMVD